MRIKIDPINYNIFRYVWIFLFVTSADIMRQQKLLRRNKNHHSMEKSLKSPGRPKNVNFETWGLNCKLDGLGGIDVVFFVPSLLCDDNYNYNWLGPGLIQSGLELFLWSLQRSRDIQIELRHPGQNTRGSRRWWADPLPGTTRTRARCQHTPGQEMVALQRNLSTFKWILRGQRNQWWRMY